MANHDIGVLRRRFAEYGQEHVFRFWEALDGPARERLARQAARVDLEALARIHADTRKLAAPGARRLEPARVQRLPGRGGDPAQTERARELGETLLAGGQVAALVVAGGQGTRLGYPGPKGGFPLGPISERTLFEIQAQKIRGVRRRHGKPLPWYVMTSPATDAATRQLFEAARYYGLPPQDVVFFCQGTVPALDFEGRLLLEAPDRIAESPDGHGGTVLALQREGILDDLEQRGITTLSYYQVDNPLVRIADAAYLGFHAEAGAEMSCKVIRKCEPMEKMGVVARIDGRVGIVEYTELDDEHRHARDASGELLYWAGNIAVHVIETAFLRRVAAAADRYLPYHASPKKIPYVDAEGRRVEPDEPNGHKLERFVFDALSAAERVAVVEAERNEEYAPVKNATGSDSPDTARAALVAQYRSWLEAGGIALPHDADWIEIDHSFIDGPEDARRCGIRDADQGAEFIRIAHGACA